MDLLIMIITSLQGLCVMIPCIMIECLLIVALIECYNNKDSKTASKMIMMMKAVAAVPLLWLIAVLVIGCFG